METLLIFFAIIAIQMIAAYSKQKKEAVKTAKNSLPSWQQTTEQAQIPLKEIRRVVRVPSKEEPELDEARVEVKNRVEVKKQEQTTKEKIIQLDLKDPAQGILWNAILHEPRYRVKWKRR